MLKAEDDYYHFYLAFTPIVGMRKVNETTCTVTIVTGK